MSIEFEVGMKVTFADNDFDDPSIVVGTVLKVFKNGNVNVEWPTNKGPHRERLQPEGNWKVYLTLEERAEKQRAKYGYVLAEMCSIYRRGAASEEKFTEIAAKYGIAYAVRGYAEDVARSAIQKKVASTILAAAVTPDADTGRTIEGVALLRYSELYQRTAAINVFEIAALVYRLVLQLRDKILRGDYLPNCSNPYDNANRIFQFDEIQKQLEEVERAAKFLGIEV